MMQLFVALFPVVCFMRPSESQLGGCSKDVVIILDGSSDVGEENFKKGKNAVEVLVNQTFPAQTYVKIGFVIFGTATYYAAFPSSHFDRTYLLTVLREATFPNSSRNTESALFNAKTLILDFAKLPIAIIILVTVGLADDGTAAIEAANEARKSEITIFAIGVKSEFTRDSKLDNFLQELRQIASDRFQLLKDFSRITYAISNIIKGHCQECPGFIQHDTARGRTFTIKKTIVGDSAYTDDICNVDKRPFGNITCLEKKPYGGIWGEFKFNPKCDFSILPDSAISNSLKNFLKVKQKENGKVLEMVADVIQNVTLTELDVLIVTDILEEANTLQVTNSNIVQNVLKVYDNLLRSGERSLEKAQQKGNAGNRILEIVDAMTGKLTPNATTGSNSIVTNTILTEVWDLAMPNVTNGLRLTNDTLSTDPENDQKKLEASITFPDGMLQKITKKLKGNKLHLSMTAYKDPRLFDVIQTSSKHPTNYTLNSKVISAKIMADGVQVTNLTSITVTTSFLPNKKLPPEYQRNLSICVYWNFTGNDNSGSWSTDGCRYAAVKDDLDVCVCDHLTNFAVLMDLDSVSTIDPIHNVAMSVITISGLCLSISGLSITVINFIIVRKYRETQAQRTLFNLALAELCAWIVFLAGFNQTQSHVGCIMAAALLHYFILASFMWMLAEAFLHYRLFVKVLGTYISKYMLKSGILAWGVPLLPVMAVMATDVNLYRRENYCWLSFPAFYYAFALPVGLVILCNLTFYIMVVVNICKRSRVTLSDEAKRERTQVNVRVSFLIFILFGLSWTFGFLAVSDAKVVFQYIFCITSSTQGFLIFLLFTVHNRIVRGTCMAWWCRKEDVTQERELHAVQPEASKSAQDIHIPIYQDDTSI